MTAQIPTKSPTQMEDWLRAEEEVTQKRAAASRSTLLLRVVGGVAKAALGSVPLPVELRRSYKGRRPMKLESHRQKGKVEQ
jgi:hypothetical protein